jgi:hypothetical protein
VSSPTGRCPACNQPVAPGAERCAACEQVLGESNLCERCHALAPALVRGVELCCPACGAVRERGPGVIIANASELERAVEVGWPQPFSAVALGAVGAAVALSLVGFALGSGHGRGVLRLLVVLALAVAAVAGLLVRHRRGLLWRRRRYVLEQRIVGLAYQRHGFLSTVDVAAALGLDAAEAEACLSELVARARASLEVSQESGQVRYVFGDVKPTRGIRIKGRDSTGSHRMPSG